MSSKAKPQPETAMETILRLLMSPGAKGKALVANRGVLLLLIPFIAHTTYKMDKRLITIESRLGITNQPTTFVVPFTSIQTPTNYVQATF
jgi:hypothetical protein